MAMVEARNGLAARPEHGRTPMTPSNGLGVPDAIARQILAAAEAERGAFLRDLAEFVNIDSGTYSREGAIKAGRWLGSFLERLGGDVRYEADPNEKVGDLVQGVFKGKEGPRLLLIGHLDTV